MRAQWKNECISLSVLLVARVQFQALAARVIWGIFPWLITCAGLYTGRVIPKVRTPAETAAPHSEKHLYLERRWALPSRHKPLERIQEIQTEQVLIPSDHSEDQHGNSHELKKLVSFTYSLFCLFRVRISPISLELYCDSDDIAHLV